jgi:hypothetical protein
MENTKIPTEIKWIVQEFEQHKRSKIWYIVATIIAIALFILAIFSNNYTFAIIIILSTLIIILHDGTSATKVLIKINEEGVFIGNNFYDYDVLKNFAVTYKPKANVRNLYFEFKSSIRQRLSISYEDKDPIQIREYLLNYLEEDLERTDLSLSESIGRILKI